MTIEPRHLKLFLDTLHCQPKEKQSTILEPIQSMITLSLLSYFPKGTKLSIHKNNLLIHESTITQGVIRWYYQDSKDDIFLLFGVIKRFLMCNEISTHPCYDLLRRRTIIGIQCLIDTYEFTEKEAIIQTLKHYQFILENYALFQETDMVVNTPREKIFQTIHEIYDKTFYDFILTFFTYIESTTQPEARRHYIESLMCFLKPKSELIHRWILENLSFN
jgi:hypothetical protein